jgi:hypothetical protein
VYSAASKGAGLRACHASISLCGRERGEIELIRDRSEIEGSSVRERRGERRG